MAASEEPELIGVGQNEPIETEIYRGGASGGKTFLVLLIVGLIGLAYLRSGSGESESLTENQEINGEEPEPAVSTTTQRRAPANSQPVTTTPNVAEGLGPVFGFDTGWDMYVGGDGAMVRLGLDDGVSEKIGFGSAPVAVVGGYLVYSSPRTDSVSYIPIGSPNADPIRIPGVRPIYGPQQPIVADGPSGGVWLLGGPWESQTWQLWELGPEPVLLKELQAPPSGFGPAAPHPDVIGASSGGVFLREGDQLTRVADGRLISVIQTHAVVEQCESPFDCEVIWFKLDSWEVDTSIRSPQVQNPYFLYLMVASPNAKFAFVYDYSDQSTSGALWNLETGEAEFDGFIEEGAGFSADGRFAAGFLRTGKVAIIDTETGELVEVDLPGVQGYGRVVFAPAN